MPIPAFYTRRFAFHFTSIHNLDTVIENGLLSTNQKIARGITHVNVAEAGIQQRRSLMAVPGAQGKCVHDYVPFYFAQKTPMQLAVLNKKNVDQELIIYFAISLQVIDSKPGVYFTNASANTEVPPRFYTGAESHLLGDLNWPIINAGKWKYPDDNERHQKMAELLVPDPLLIGEINYIVVWDAEIKKKVEECFIAKNIPCPRIEINLWHYYTDPSDHSTSLITGPYFLRKMYEASIEIIKLGQLAESKFPNLATAVASVRLDFDAIRELADINGLGANYGPHSDDVGTHSRRVAALAIQSPEYELLDSREKLILEMAAYLHDIGKGPKARWPNSHMAKADNNHARKSLPMLERILTQDIGGLCAESIRQLVMLVTYDDLLGDIAANGRECQQLFDIVTCENDVNMLVALSRADIGSINQQWLYNTYRPIEQLRVDAFEFLRGREQC